MADPSVFARIASRAGSTGAWQAHEGDRGESAAQPTAWMKTLQAVIAESRRIAESGELLVADRRLIDDEPAPFQELLLPFVRIARRDLLQRAGMRYTELPAEVQAMLERWLLWSLCHLGGQCFELEFSLFRRGRDFLGLSFIAGAQGNATYRAFVQQLTGDALLRFFAEYSVLAHLMVLRCAQWAETCAELLERFTQDRRELEGVFNHGRDLGVIIRIKAGCSDYHRNGRTVFILTFSSGLRLVYKPKSLRADEAFYRLIVWLNAHGSPESLDSARFLDRGAYGWMEYIEHTSCGSRQEAAQYYRRAGALLCLLYTLCATDCHRENLIARGGSPMLVDLETIMHQRPARRRSAAAPVLAQDGAEEQLYHSVLRTGLLPSWVSFGSGGAAVDVSGLGGVFDFLSLRPSPRWKHINTDRMVLEPEYVPVQKNTNSVSVGEQTVDPSEFADDVAQGFSEMYSFLVRQRAALADPAGPLSVFSGCRTRFVFRPTHIYFALLKSLLHPDYMRDAVRRQAQLSRLKDGAAGEQAQSPFASLFDGEIYALSQLDIPLCLTWTDSGDVELDGGAVIQGFFDEPGISRLQSRIAELDDADLERQLGFIRASFFPQPTIKPHSIDHIAHSPAAPADSFALTQADLLAEGVAIARELRSRAIAGSNGSATWIGLDYNPVIDRFQLRPIGYDLYEGACGIAVFLAAVGRLTGEAEYRETARAALQPLYRQLSESSGQQFGKTIGIGGAVGLGSVVYGLAKVGRYLADAQALDYAHKATRLITAEAIKADSLFDIVAGCAGAILGLLALNEATPDHALVERAVLCGNQLVDQQSEITTGGKSWTNSMGQTLTGFSHGAAGIAYALLRLYDKTHIEAFRNAANAAISFESGVFAPEMGNWPDHRDVKRQATRPRCMTSWCHGAPGIGLARLGCLGVIDDKRIKRDIEVALETTRAFGIAELDNICCGNFGRIEFLLSAGRAFERPDLLQLTHQQSAQLVDRAKRQGGFYLLGNLPPGVFNPGLFQGVAGIGYALLRLACPDQFDNLLLWS